MRVALNWLKEYVDIEYGPEALAEKLTRAGIAVERIIYPGAGTEGVTTGRIMEICPHPQTGKLLVCAVDAGGDAPLNIVTGAGNLAPGAVVPVAVEGALLPDGRVIKTAVLRGVRSEGMLCSASELGIEDKLLRPEEREGIFILPPGTLAGLDVKAALSWDGAVLELELTANRGDCMSMIGVAREAAALCGGKVRHPRVAVKEEGGAMPAVEVKITDPHLCPRFSARAFTNIKIQPSPLWLQNRLRLSGVRPINNVVDVTNYVMLEMGQPMHAYDSRTLAGSAVIIRSAAPGEKLVTLDGGERTLEEGMIVIADRDKAIGLGGVMGGLATEISAATEYVLLEAACFDPAQTRRTSRALGLASEASARFVHGIDRENVAAALDRAAQLLEGIGAAKACVGKIDNYPGKVGAIKVRTTETAMNKRIGTDLPVGRMAAILENLAFQVETAGESLNITVPSWRNDVREAADISEEIARSVGFDNIAGTLPQAAMARGGQSRLSALAGNVKNLLTAAGLNEIIGYSFIGRGKIDKLDLAADDPRRRAIPVLNPIADDFAVMRTTLVPSLLGALAHNIAHRNEDAALFEIGSIYLSEELPLNAFPREETLLCAVLIGGRYPAGWNQPAGQVDFYDVKGLAEEIFAQLNIKDCAFAAGTETYLHPGKSAWMIRKGEKIGAIGEIHPQVADAFDLPAACLLELNLSSLAGDAGQTARYVKLPKYPENYRDLSMTVPAQVSYEKIAAAIRENGGPFLSSLRLFDLYTGKQIPEGYKSMAWRLFFQSPERTLADGEVNAAIAGIVAALERDLSIKLRAV
ncbi:MAG: phenylalanine--tRNA ligase subunit beta [Acidaminococcales bacterium]|jgi:phenylalanyl-tRNA synthetase beta chain|nr:phenylalanine--tRNA ligase subunit beta [Acidaminococcales bacterium]